VKKKLHQLSVILRTRHWRLSFVPFIMGCVYLWLGWFKIEACKSSFLLVLLSLLTATGFAALGYFINEYFDIHSDAKAGKLNKISLLSFPVKTALFIGILMCTFLPWCWLPSNQLSWFLISLQIIFYLIYSLPFFRLKEVPVISNFIDAGYAYWIPLLLSHHTYSLFSSSGWAPWLPFLSIAVFFIGFRNITIHQIDDIFNDKRVGFKTLPMMLGVQRTDFLIKIFLVSEVIFLFAALVKMAWELPIYFIVVGMFAFFTTLSLWRNRAKLFSPYFVIEEARILTDSTHQYVLPLTALAVLCFQNPWYVLLIPLHLWLLFPHYYLYFFWRKIVSLWYKVKFFLFVHVRHAMSIAVNYPIYFVFKWMGVDLIKEKKTAADVIFRRCREK
jgi:4-hydroxybenzoate polyprenyltransferase